MLAYDKKDVITLKTAYSQVSDDGTMTIDNLATGSQQAMKAESKLYTEVWWDYGVVGAVGSKAFSLSASISTVYDSNVLLAYYYIDVNPDGSNESVIDKDDQRVSEYLVYLSKSFGPLDTALVVSYDEIKETLYMGQESNVYLTAVQLYLTYNF
jgi:hypothetical protein